MQAKGTGEVSSLANDERNDDDGDDDGDDDDDDIPMFRVFELCVSVVLVRECEAGALCGKGGCVIGTSSTWAWNSELSELNGGMTARAWK